MFEYLIDTGQQLTDFRERYLNPESFISEVKNSIGAVFYCLAVGVGKSAFVDRLIDWILDGGGEAVFDLVIVLAPTHKILDERKVQCREDAQHAVVRLFGRPRHLCGSELDQRWSGYERRASFALGKKHLCGNCPQRESCCWPKQFKKLKPGIRVVLMTQKYLQLNSDIVNQIMQMTDAKNPLIILDESDISTDIYHRFMRRDVLENFSTVLCHYLQNQLEDQSLSLRNYQDQLSRLLKTANVDVINGFWSFPMINQEISAVLQQIGEDFYGDHFYYPGYDLYAFSCQNPRYRQIDGERTIVFSSIPRIEHAGKVLILSGTASVEVLEHRLDMKVNRILPDFKFRHEHSCFYNINYGGGIDDYYDAHLKTMIDFAVEYIISRIRQNRSVALITKKKYLDVTVNNLNRILKLRGWGFVTVVAGDLWKPEAANTDRILVPVLHYKGAIGVNTYSTIDCVLCLCGYYMRMDELNRMVNEVIGQRYHQKVTLHIEGAPLRRRVRVVDFGRSSADYVHHIATAVLEQEEMGVVIQAIGRIRPFTNPREVVTCQCGESCQLSYDREFINLEEARAYFGLCTDRTYKKKKAVLAVQYGKRSGLTQRQIAEKSGLGLRTVTRYWDTMPERL